MGKYSRAHIGKTFNDGNLTVVDGGDRTHYVKVKCHVCAEDAELFGDGVFEVQFSNLNRGQSPCGCGIRSIKWSLSQYEVLIKRKITRENLPIEFVSFVTSKLAPSLTPIKLLCKRRLVEYEVSSVNNFLQGVGNLGKFYVTTNRIDEYNLHNPYYKVWDSGKISYGKLICGFYCEICESKGFDSVFEINSSHLFAGSIPCYCSKSKINTSGDHVAEVTKNLLHNQELKGLSVLGVYRKGGIWKSVFLCDIHGVYSRTYGHLSTTGCNCLKCDLPKTGYNKNKQGSLYLLDIQTTTETILGYGITNKFSSRITSHKRNLKSMGATITNIQVFEGSGTAVLAVENAIKALHPTGLIDCEGFRRESISINRKEEVLEKCSKLKELDNVDKLL